ncbi:MAG: T9SS type A sorting domain-containing protein [Lentimicrobium sp.]|nr:T9SS type A sorting domain-containing protein [Lentimicrobium sp.]
MNKITLLITALILNFSMAISQSCLPEGITFTTQEEIDNFQTDYPGCTAIEGFVTIRGYDEITNLNGLSVLTSVGGTLEFYSCAVLTSLSGLENLTYIGGHLEVYMWPSGTSVLTNLTGLNNLTTIGSGLNITNTDVLSSLTGLENVTTIGGFLQIAGNEALTNLSGLDNVTSIGGEIWIGENTALTDLSGLGNLTSVGGDFEIYESSLSSLNGLGKLNTIGGVLKINYSDHLTDLSGLGGLHSIGGNMEIYSNEALTSLSGLDSVAPASISEIYIRYNPLLSTCQVKSVCDYLAGPTGDITISDNATGCNSRQEVEDACAALSVDDIISGNEITFAPNPLTDQTVLRLNQVVHESIDICIFNTLGVCLKSWHFGNTSAVQTQFLLDMHGISSGIYFCRIKIGKETITKKIVKMN